MDRIFIEKRHLKLLHEIFQELCPNAVIWAYGSRINGRAHVGSDLDLAIIKFGENACTFSELREALTESNIPFLVDLFELKKLPKSFQSQIEQNYVVIFDGQQTA